MSKADGHNSKCWWTQLKVLMDTTQSADGRDSRCWWTQLRVLMDTTQGADVHDSRCWWTQGADGHDSRCWWTRLKVLMDTAQGAPSQLSLGSLATRAIVRKLTPALACLCSESLTMDWCPKSSHQRSPAFVQRVRRWTDTPKAHTSASLSLFRESDDGLMPQKLTPALACLCSESQTMDWCPKSSHQRSPAFVQRVRR